MLKDQLKELLKQIEPDIELIRQFFSKNPVDEKINKILNDVQNKNN